MTAEVWDYWRSRETLNYLALMCGNCNRSNRQK
jgi:hypothetical protein